MGAHALPIVTSIVMRDTADVFDQHEIDAEAVAEQARTILEDVTIAGWKVGFLGNADNVSAVAEILSDYNEIPLVSYLPNLSWLEEDQLQPYLDAFRELILPATEVLVGSHKTLQDFLLPEWDSERPPSARELAVAAGEHGTRYVLVTGVMLASKGAEQFIDNVLASPQGAIAGEKFERFDTSFVGAGDTLAAALAASRWPPCCRPAASCRLPWAKPCPSWTRAWMRASGRAWGTSCRTASSGPCPRPTRKARPTPGAPEPEDPKGKTTPRRVH